MNSADRWLRQAERDIESARHAAGGGFHALACFQSQQAAEKSVAGYLLERGAERVWGHALADLCEDAMALDKSFDVIKSVAILLDKHYSQTRYPVGLPGGVPADAYDAQDSDRAIEIARDVLAFVNTRIADERSKTDSAAEASTPDGAA